MNTVKLENLSAVIAEALDSAGGVAAVAAAIGKTREAVRLWRVRGHVPDRHLVELERLSGVPRERLRPDLYVRQQEGWQPPIRIERRVRDRRRQMGG